MALARLIFMRITSNLDIIIENWSLYKVPVLILEYTMCISPYRHIAVRKIRVNSVINGRNINGRMNSWTPMNSWTISDSEFVIQIEIASVLKDL